MDIIAADYNEDLVKNMLHKVNFPALKAAAINLQIGSLIQTSECIVEDIVADDTFLRELHHLLLEVHVQQGALVCPNTGRKFPIKDGIPNMLLHEDEV